MTTQYEWIGWAASLLGFWTMGSQVYKQYKTKDVSGISPILFIGQIISEIGYIFYTWVNGEWVFFVSNIVIMIINLTGLGLVWRYR